MLKRILKAILIGILLNVFIIGLVVGSYNYFQNQDVTRLAIRGLQNQINIIQNEYNNLLDNDIELLKAIQVQSGDSKIENELINSEINKLAQKINDLTKNETNIQKLLKSNVFVKGIMGMGAGTVIKKTEKYMYILTCYHVVADVIESNKQGFKMGASVGYSKIDEYNQIAGLVIYGAEVIKYDEENDLALLKVFLVDDNIEAVSVAETKPNLGDIVYSIGSPLGLLRTISKGILSHHEDGFYFSDNTTTYGNSGGGLYNSRGELIGVPSNVTGYRVGEDGFIPESSLGMSRDLQTIKTFLEGVEF